MKTLMSKHSNIIQKNGKNRNVYQGKTVKHTGLIALILIFVLSLSLSAFAANGNGGGNGGGNGNNGGNNRKSSISGGTTGSGDQQRLGSMFNSNIGLDDAYRKMSVGLISFQPTLAADSFQARAEAYSDKKTLLEQNAFDGELNQLFIELETLRTESFANHETIHSVNEAIKTQIKALRDSARLMDPESRKNTWERLKLQIKEQRKLIAVVREEIRAMQKTKTEAWVRFRTAVKEDNAANGEVELKLIIELKNKIIGKQNEMIVLKNNFLTFLNNITLIDTTPM